MAGRLATAQDGLYWAEVGRRAYAYNNDKTFAAGRSQKERSELAFWQAQRDLDLQQSLEFLVDEQKIK